MADCKPKFKFKKPKTAKKKQIRRDADHGDLPATDAAVPSADAATNKVDDNGGEDEVSALEKIRAVEKRRKLFSRTRGVDAANLGKQALRHPSDGAEDDDLGDAMIKNKDLEDRLKGTFAEGKLAGSNDMGGDEEGGVLAKKHKRAMEEYIRSNLQERTESCGASNNEHGSEFKTSADLEKEMYSELLGSAAAGAENAKQDLPGEGDVGAGGTMMMGSGIAEVTLPVDERIKALKETEKAAAEYERRRGRLGDDGKTQNLGQPVNESLDSAATVPMSFASGPSKRKRHEAIPDTRVLPAPKQQTSTFNPNDDFQFPVHSSALPAGSFTERTTDTENVSSSYSHNFALHNREWIEAKKDERQAEIDAITAANVETGPEESKARVGFDVARKLAKGEAIPDGGNVKGPKGESLKNEWDRKHVSNDDRVWKTFLSNERNRR